jgi:hypothetical protein
MGCEESWRSAIENARLVNFDAVAIGVVEKDLVPARDGPASVIRVADPQFIAAAHEPLDVVGAEAEVTVPHWVDELLHLEARLEVALRPVELDVSICQEVDLAGVSAVLADSADDGVLLVADRSEIKQGLVELGWFGEAGGR